MNDSDNRRFPRIAHVTSRQIVRIDESQNPKKNFVLTENLSGCGIKFTTNEKIKDDTHFLIYLNDMLVKDLNQNGKNLLKSGDYYLCKVVWAKEIRPKIFEIGAAFLEKKTCDSDQIETFTELVNISMLDSLPEIRKQI